MEYKGRTLDLPLSDDNREFLRNRGKDLLINQLDRQWASLEANRKFVEGSGGEESEVEEIESYDKLTKDQLIEEIEERNKELPDGEKMSTSGNKGELIARLESDDARE
jgi:hypothetical protein